MMDYRIRLTLPKAHDINAEIKKILDRKAESITKKPELRTYLAWEYANQVKRFIPYKTGKLANSAFVTNDFRVVWSAIKHGFNYAYMQYYTPSTLDPKGGKKNELYYHPVRYNGHEPTDRWTNMVHPQTGPEEWAEYMNRVSKRITEAYKNG